MILSLVIRYSLRGLTVMSLTVREASILTWA